MSLRDFVINRNLSIYEQYQSTYLYVTKKLGPKTAVLLQVGATYEIFCITEHGNGAEFNKPSNNFYELADAMNLMITHRGKGVDGSEANPHMAGFPTGSLVKYSNMLLAKDFSVVVCDQDSEDSDGRGKQRSITEVLTPGTIFKSNSLTANKLIILYVENQNPKNLITRIDRADLCIGICAMNVLTGETTLFDMQISPSNSKVAKQYNLEEIYRFIHSNNCRELVIHLKNFNSDGGNRDKPYTPSSVKAPEVCITKLSKNYGSNEVKSNEVKSDSLNSGGKDNDRNNGCENDGANGNYFEEIERYFRETLALDQYFVQQFTFNQVDDNWLSPRYQKNVIEKLFENRFSMITLELEYITSAVVAYLIAIEHVRQRNPALIKHLPKPNLWRSDNIMILTHNAIQQLELSPSTSINSNNVNSHDKKLTLFDIVDNTTTAEGKRQLEQLLFTPFYDPLTLKTKHNQVECMINKGKEFIDNLSKQLRSTCDFKKFHRRLETNTLSPFQLNKLIKSYDIINQIHSFIGIDGDLSPSTTSINKPVDLPKLDENVLERFREYINNLKTVFNLDKLAECKTYKTIPIKLINDGILTDLDESYSKVNNLDVLIVKLRNVLAKIIDIDVVDPAKLVSIKSSGNSDSYFEVPNKVRGLLEFYKNSDVKYASLQDFIHYHGEELNDADLIDCADKMKFKKDYEPREPIEMTRDELNLINSLKFIRMSNKTKVYSSIIVDIQNNGTKYVTEFTTMMTNIYNTVLPQIYDMYEQDLQIIVEWLAQIDLIKSHALTAMKNNYYKPTIIENENSSPSYIRAKNIRHPIIEKINDNIRYIPNDLNLGYDQKSSIIESDNSDNNVGLFLCSSNSSGKTSMIKATGLNVILAQCGMYVAATDFVLNPFKNLITRLSGSDNMYKRQGSFAVEMSELCTIMNHGANKSLVLGDEICRGTETDSATDIVASSAIVLCRRGINFIFSTHLTTVEYVKEIAEFIANGKLKYMHFSTKISLETQEIVFEHKLQNGSGPKLYGIEIADVMGLDKEVISLAYELRNRRQNPTTHDIPLGGNKKSRYNSKKLLGLCEIKECQRKAVDTHHIIGQCTADQNGNIDHFHKDEAHNLVCLCKECHNSIHNSKTLVIYGWKQTAQGGIKLLYNDKRKE